MKMRFLRPGYFLWILGPLAAWGGYQAFGLPHVIWSYSFTGAERAGDYAGRWYTRCTFVGPYGALTTYPSDGECGWLIFRKNAAEAAQ